MNFYDSKLQKLYEAGLQLRPFLQASNDTEEFGDGDAGAASYDPGPTRQKEVAK